MPEQNLSIVPIESNTNREADIAVLAYRFYEEEGRPEGKAQEHWLRAEELLRERARTTGPNASQVGQIFGDHAVEL